MHIHRSAHARSFTVLPNATLQDRSLSFTARGLLADLLSRPDGHREDGRQMADTSPQGRGTVRRALKELTAAGYYRVDTVRLPNGTLRSEAHVFDTPQLGPPTDTHPEPGEPDPGPPDTLPKEPGNKEPSLPDRLHIALQVLRRVLRSEPRLRLGEAEALTLAPLVARWLERGSTVADLARALLPDLPAFLRSPVGILRNRLERKLPPPPSAPPPPRLTECPACHDPIPVNGPCRSCTGLARPRVAVGLGAAVTAAGAARARAAMLATCAR
ncbi:hypothetical protein C7C46_12615 [Streptomyces tateyamensis]|uniref:Helix-turn-helix domain-containing protein n=1 Tax=Streptomyces tateyamensis TaxID=565073 RepID=A0A2V4P718_9ACTN|nr:hypothetical protein [Streptomyces tateyamensis]PYC80528.1 hypothetical protein C7C46_12615 [Streptomyces tateyamensis]